MAKKLTKKQRAENVKLRLKSDELFQAGQLEEALTYIDRIIEIDPDQAEVWVNRGIVNTLLEKLEDALIDYTQAIELNDNMARAYDGRGTVKSLLSRREDAIKDYDEALK